MTKEYVSSVTQRGQVTIPAEIRRPLRTEPRETVAFRVDGNDVRLAPVELSREEVFGSVQPLSRPEDLEERIRSAREGHVERILREMREG